VYAIGEVIVTVARRAGSIFEAPLALSVVERKDLRRLKGVGIEETLKGIPGVLAQSCSGTQDARITIPGFGSRGASEHLNAGTSRGVRILLDGIPLTEPDGRTSFDLVDLSTAGRVEVGPLQCHRRLGERRRGCRQHSLHYFTAGKTGRLGAEAGLSAQFAGGVSAGRSLTLLQSTYVDYRVDSVHYGRPGSVADLSGNASAGIPILYDSARLRHAPGSPMGLFLEVSLERIGRSFADDYNTFAVPPVTVWHPGAGLNPITFANSSVAGRLGASLRNVGNRTYAALGWVNPDLDEQGELISLEPGLPRTVVVSLGFRRTFCGRRSRSLLIPDRFRILEELPDACGGFLPDDLGELFRRGEFHPLHRPERLQKLLGPLFADSLDKIQFRLKRSLGTEGSMIGHGKAVGLVSHLLQQPQAGRCLGQQCGFGTTGHKDLLKALGQSDDALIPQAEFAQHLQCGRELPLPPVDHDQIGECPLFVQEAAVAAADNLPHAGKIIRPVSRPDLEFTVLALAWLSVNEDHH
jgi:hypothetical protein